MAKRKHNRYDKYARETFLDRDRSINFLENYLPETLLAVLEINSLVVTQKSYINAELTEHFSDLVFEIKLIK